MSDANNNNHSTAAAAMASNKRPWIYHAAATSQATVVDSNKKRKVAASPLETTNEDDAAAWNTTFELVHRDNTNREEEDYSNDNNDNSLAVMPAHEDANNDVLQEVMEGTASYEENVSAAKKKHQVLNDEKWNFMFSKLERYKEQHGDCLVPYGLKEDSSDTPKLCYWVSDQRRYQKKGKLPPERFEKLESIGFTWNADSSTKSGFETKEDAWNNMYERLVAYKDKHGDCLVPHEYKEDSKLAGWVHNQRTYYKTKKLSDHRIEKLNSVEFVWNADTSEAFDTMCDRLMAYKNVHGHCNVPKPCSEDPKLGRWLSKKREQYKKGKLPQDRIQKLEEIGILWTIKDTPPSFETMCDLLVAFKDKHGHCKVPQLYPEHQKLAYWVKNQREFKRKNKLSKERIDKLDSLGFVWSLRSRTSGGTTAKPLSFDEMCDRLSTFKQEHGHCRVPQGYKQDLKLSQWVKKQREYKKAGKLLPEQVEKLDAMGFTWSVRQSSRKRSAAGTSKQQKKKSAEKEKPHQATTSVEDTEEHGQIVVADV